MGADTGIYIVGERRVIFIRGLAVLVGVVLALAPIAAVVAMSFLG